jgi:hypothetical protein
MKNKMEQNANKTWRQSERNEISKHLYDVSLIALAILGTLRICVSAHFFNNNTTALKFMQRRVAKSFELLSFVTFFGNSFII